MTTDSPIHITALNHWFGTNEARKQAITDINLTIAKGSLTALVGPSGSGKTTLLTLMGCLREVHDGSIRLLNHELHGAPETLSTQLRRRLGFIFQAHNLHSSLTALQNVRMGLQVHDPLPPTRETEAATHALSLLGLADRLHYLPANLSGGQKQRVAIARALVGNPAVIFADEPTAALDKDSAATVITLLKRLGTTRGTTTILVTHDPRILDRVDRILTLEDGRLTNDTAPI